MSYTHRSNGIERAALFVGPDAQKPVERAGASKRVRHIERMEAAPIPGSRIGSSRVLFKVSDSLIRAGDEQIVVGAKASWQPGVGAFTQDIFQENFIAPPNIVV